MIIEWPCGDSTIVGREPRGKVEQELVPAWARAEHEARCPKCGGKASPEGTTGEEIRVSDPEEMRRQASQAPLIFQPDNEPIVTFYPDGHRIVLGDRWQDNLEGAAAEFWRLVQSCAQQTRRDERQAAAAVILAETAIRYINLSPGDPDVVDGQIEAWHALQEARREYEAATRPRGAA